MVVAKGSEKKGTTKSMKKSFSFSVKIPELKAHTTALYGTMNYRINKSSGLLLSLGQVAVIDQFVQPACRIPPDRQTLVINVRINIRLASL